MEIGHRVAPVDGSNRVGVWGNLRQYVGFYIELKRQLFRDNALYHRYLATKVSSSPTLLRCWGFARVAFL